eukprot:SAG22_NODE_12091_length_456_cov_1.422969_1_plen_94_part_10
MTGREAQGQLAHRRDFDQGAPPVAGAWYGAASELKEYLESAPQLTDMPLEVMNHIGSHLKPHSVVRLGVVRLGQALKTSIGREFRIGHMKDYHN